MTTVVSTRAIYLELLASCKERDCQAWAGPLHRQLSRGYDECSTLRLPHSIEHWQDEHRTARKRSWRAERLGYRWAPVLRHEHVGDIFEINTSLPERQGRPMSDGYRTVPSASPDPLYSCPLHGIHAYGVLLDETLVAYAWIYRSGDLALVSQILGHGEHLRFDVMYLLMRGVVEAELEFGGFLVYNRHDSGTDGLRFYKERCGFESTEVAWAL